MGKAIKGSDLIDKSVLQSLNEIERSLQSLVKGFEQVTKSSQQVLNANKKTQQTFSQASESIKKTAANTQQLSALEKERIRVQNQLNTTLAKSITINDKNTKDLQSNKTALQQNTKAQKQAAEIARLRTKEGQKLNQTLKAQQKELSRLKGTSGGLTGAFKKMGTQMLATGAAIFGITRLLTGFNNLIKNAINNADKQLKAERSLLVALDGREDVQQRLIKQAQQLQKETLFGDEETIKAQALIAAFVKEGDQIERIIPLVQDLATAKGMDLSAAADLVSKTLGSSTNALSRYGIQVEGTVGSTQRLESLSKGLSNAFGGQAVAAAKAGSGGLTQLKNVLGDVSENLGKKLLPFINRVSQSLINKLAPQEKEVNLYRLQNRELTTLFASLRNTNLSQEARKKLIETINTKYKAYLPNLLTEKSTLQDIERAEASINKQLKLKLIQQAFQEEMTNIIKEELRAKETLVQNEINLDKVQQDRIIATTEADVANIKSSELAINITNSLAKSTIENNEKEIVNTKDKFKRIGELYGIAFNEIEDILNKQQEIITQNNNKEEEEEEEKNKRITTNRIAEIELQNQTAINSQKELLLNKEINEQVFASRILEIEIATQERLLQISNLSAEERLNFQTQLLDKKKALMDSEVAFMEGFLFTEQEYNDIAAEEEKTQAEESKRLNDEVTQNKLANLEKEKQAREAITAESINLANSIFELGSSIREREISEIEAQKEKELGLAGDNEEKKAKIEEKYAKKSAGIKRKQAIADKAQAIFNALINTAVAVTKTLAFPVLSAIIAAAGALQVAAIIAKPIPKFADGVLDKPDSGLSIVGDEIGSKSGHSRELINIPGQGFMLSPDKPTLMNLPKGSDVIPNIQTELLLKGGIQSEKLNEMINSNKRIESAIRNKPEHITNITDAGIESMVRAKNSLIREKNIYLRQ